jgi:class 3 adenylate cyclase/tetratricopeptide (TPR) repeat protein
VLTCPTCGRESPDDFTFCPACASPLAPGPREREVRRTVTVVFCDVSGSTALGERLDPESLRDVQSRYFDAMRGAIERHGGTVEKYIGDAVMAVFGIPRLHEDDALRAARAAVDMREALAALNEELERDRGVAIDVRIGANTGEVVAGDPAAGQALVTGDAVNVAARLEQHAPPGEILLGEDTYRLVRDAVEARPVEPLEMKGKAGPVAAWRLLAVRDVATVVSRHLDSPMVGRERPLARLRQAYEAAVEDSGCQLFTLLGSAGVGKSRLVEEFLSGLDGATTVLRGRCLPYGEGITYFPVVEAIKEAAGLADFDLPEVVEAKVCSVLEGDEHQELVCRHVAQLIGVARSAVGEETFWAIRRFFEATAREHPLVLVFDDVHWGEPTFLDLLEHIADWSRGSPILLLCMARSELLDVRPTWGGGKLNAATVSLEPLTVDQAGTLVANLLGSADVPQELTRAIVERAEGNPLFVEETLAMLIDDGLVTREGERWRVTGDLAAVTMPPTIHALVAARLDRLSLEERAVLEVAAVAGKDFFVGVVRDLVPEELRERVPSQLMSLVRKELIHPQRSTLPGEDAFRFRHLLIRDSAYDAIAKARRAELHERAADWLERTAGEAVAEQEEIVGYHLEQAWGYRIQLGPPDERSDAIGRRAATRLATAGRRALGRGDLPASVNLLRRALVLGPSAGAERAATLYDLAVALEDLGDARAAFETFDEVVRLAAASGDRSLRWLAAIWRSEVQTNVDPRSLSQQECRDELEEAIRAFEELGDEAGLATAWTKLAFIDFYPCRYDHAQRGARRAAEHARRIGDDRLLTDALQFLLLSQSLGSTTPEEGRRTLDELSDDISRSRSLESTALVAAGLIAVAEGSIDEGRRLTRLAAQIAEALGARTSIGHRLGFQAAVERAAGDLIAAEHAYRQQYELFEELGQRSYASTAAADLARVLCALDRFDEAERFAAIARSVAAEDDLNSQVLGSSAQAVVLAARGRFDEAERLARETVGMLEGAEFPMARGDVQMDLARVLRMAGRLTDSEVAAREALASYERKGHRPSAASARAFLDELASTAS